MNSRSNNLVLEDTGRCIINLRHFQDPEHLRCFNVGSWLALHPQSTRGFLGEKPCLVFFWRFGFTWAQTFYWSEDLRMIRRLQRVGVVVSNLNKGVFQVWNRMSWCLQTTTNIYFFEAVHIKQTQKMDLEAGEIQWDLQRSTVSGNMRQCLFKCW